MDCWNLEILLENAKCFFGERNRKFSNIRAGDLRVKICEKGSFEYCDFHNQIVLVKGTEIRRNDSQKSCKNGRKGIILKGYFRCMKERMDLASSMHFDDPCHLKFHPQGCGHQSLTGVNRVFDLH